MNFEEFHAPGEVPLRFSSINNVAPIYIRTG
jgi:hypothetical protein